MDKMDRVQKKEALEYCRGYFKLLDKIASNERKIKEWEVRLQEKEKEQRELNHLNIDAEEGFGISYEEKVQTSSNGTSVVENQTIRYITKLQNECIRIKEEINALKDEITEINVNYGDLKRNIENLGEYEKSILFILCKENRDYEYLNCTMFPNSKSRTSMNTVVTKLLKSVLNWGWEFGRE